MKAQITDKIYDQDISKGKDSRLMAQLLNQSPPIPKVGQIVKGKILEIGRFSILVDLGPLGTGIILGREIKESKYLLKSLELGDEVSIMVVEPENENGYVELSLKDAHQEQIWNDLNKLKEEKGLIKIKIIQANRGGLVVEFKGITGFLPVSQLSTENYPRIDDGDKQKILNHLNKFVNKEMQVKIIDIDAKKSKLIVSEKASEQEQVKEILKDFKVGDVIEGEVSGVVDFGAFVRFKPKNKKEKFPDILEGLVHISELDWQLIEDPRTIVKTGDKVQAKIIGIENDGRISLSIKALKKNPWEEIENKYQKDQIINGKITKFNHFGVFVQIDKDIHGLVHVSEFENAQDMKEKLEIGKEYKFKILSIEPKSHKMALSLAK